MGGRALENRSRTDRAATKLYRIGGPHYFRRLACCAAESAQVHELAIEVRDSSGERTAKDHRSLRNGVEHRVDVIRRCRNRAQDFGGCGLIAERFPGFLEQPDVLDCDLGLVSERR